jgi:DNA-binding transcriptional LysR family regulator
MMDLEAMRIYVRVAELASFTRAAQQLKVPKATVSDTVQRLEALLGARLLQRTTRSVQLTPEGQRFLDRCRDLLADADDLAHLFRGGHAALQGRLRVDLPAGVARAVVVPRLGDFLRRHSQLQVELGTADARVDLLAEGVDCVLRVGALEASSLAARPLGELRRISCASPDYLYARGWPETLDDLAWHRLVCLDAGRGGEAPGFGYIDPADGQSRNLPLERSLTVASAEDAAAACLAGLGVVQGPDIVLRTHVDEGRLVEILPAWRAAPLPVTLLYTPRRHVARRLQVFMDWLEGVMRPFLLAAASVPPPGPATSGTASAR